MARSTAECDRSAKSPSEDLKAAFPVILPRVRLRDSSNFRLSPVSSP